MKQKDELIRLLNENIVSLSKSKQKLKKKYRRIKEERSQLLKTVGDGDQSETLV
jgi:hypothetical protein